MILSILRSYELKSMMESFSNNKALSFKGFLLYVSFAILFVTTVVVVFLGIYGTFTSGLSNSGLTSSDSDLHYAIVIDAGSSGSRAYLYGWPNHSGNPHELLKIRPLKGIDGEPLVEKVKPGISTLENTPEKALEYISPLLRFCESHIPIKKHKETPLFILATAGMRLISKEKQNNIINHLKIGIGENFQFIFPESNLEIISGKQEGIYQWLAINYVLGKFSSHSGNDKEISVKDKLEHDHLVFRSPTVGAIDMGGASMQIAMEITSQLQMSSLTDVERSQVAEINLGCKEHDTEHTYRVFVKTFLGYGANEALARSKRKLFLDQKNDSSSIKGLSNTNRLSDPCLPRGLLANSTMKLESINNPSSLFKEISFKDQIEIYYIGTGDWEGCYNSIKEFTSSRDPYITCQQNCPDNGIKLPSIHIENSEFYGFSEFWYSMEDVLNMGGPYLYDKYKKASSVSV